MGFDSYVAILIIIPPIMGFLTLIPALWISVHHVGLIKGAALSIIALIVAVILSYAVVLYHPITSYSDRRRSIEARLPLIASVMVSIAASGLPPSILMLHLYRIREMLGIDKEIEYIVGRAVGGADLPAALREAADFTPSRLFSDLLRGIAANIEGGVGISAFLESFLNTSLSALTLKLRNATDTLSFLMEVYVSIGVIFPLLTITLLLFLGSLGSMPYDPYMILGAVIFVVLPASFAALLILADLTISGVKL